MKQTTPDRRLVIEETTGADMRPVYLIETEDCESVASTRNEADAKLIVKALTEHAALCAVADLAEKIERSACLSQYVGEKCICFRCEASRLLSTLGRKRTLNLREDSQGFVSCF